tara:strand:- start:9494 stop:10540 length:1047 start_codon:yes stop_codon:yes gene_type:complete
MAKFLDKKERVMDIKLTSYGKHLLSTGKFKPVYYAFYDDNVIYDGDYINNNESQNGAHTRIKEETPYIESLVLFEDIDNKMQKIPTVDETGLGIISIDTVPLESEKPRIDNFRYDNAIGDALLNGEQPNLVPSWKLISLQSYITSSARLQTETSVVPIPIPQINISASYKKQIVDSTDISIIPDSITETEIQTSVFADNKIIQLVMDDPIIYLEEVNTELLNENFEIEVFELEPGLKSESLTRKYFESKKEQIVDGMMVTANPTIDQSQSDGEEPPNNDIPFSKNAVEYYFTILKDKDVDQEIVCKSMQKFNKDNYYVDLDFDCNTEDEENFFNDIYGSEVVPEICLD